MPSVVALWTQDFAVGWIEPLFGDSRKRLDVMNMKNNTSAAALAGSSILHAAFLALIPMQAQRRLFPFSILNRSSQLEIQGGFATFPISV
jgi:hypothetical protein